MSPSDVSANLVGFMSLHVEIISLGQRSLNPDRLDEECCVVAEASHDILSSFYFLQE